MLYHYISLTDLKEGKKVLSHNCLSYCNDIATSKKREWSSYSMIKMKKIKVENNTTRRRRSVEGKGAPTRDLFFFFFPPQEHLNVTEVTLPLRWRWEVKGSGLLLGVELVLQLHEFARSFDLVGNLLPLREETLALLEGQTLRSAAGDRVLLLLTVTHTRFEA